MSAYIQTDQEQEYEDEYEAEGQQQKGNNDSQSDVRSTTSSGRLKPPPKKIAEDTRLVPVVSLKRYEFLYTYVHIYMHTYFKKSLGIPDLFL